MKSRKLPISPDDEDKAITKSLTERVTKERPRNPFVREVRTPDRKLVRGGAEGWLPSEIAMESSGPLSNEEANHNYLAKQYRKSAYKRDGSWRQPQKLPVGGWKTK